MLLYGLLAIMVIGLGFALLGLVTGSYTGSLSLDGVSGSASATITGEVGVKANPSPLIGQAGTLSTRTSDTAGTLTLETGHGVTTGSRIDLYWDGGTAYGITVGTVSGNSVPFTGASGDVLPSATTVIIAGKCNEAVFNVVGDNMEALLLSTSTSSGYAVIADGSGNLHASYITPSTPYMWYSASGITNPIAGDTATKVFFSQRGVTATATDMKATAIVA